VEGWEVNPTCRTDGSVHFVSESISFTVFQDLATIAGGEVNTYSN
jgi:hypothetical protein